MVKNVTGQPRVIKRKLDVEGDGNSTQIKKTGQTRVAKEVDMPSAEQLVQSGALAAEKGAGTDTQLGTDQQTQAGLGRLSTSGADRMSPLGARFALNDGASMNKGQIFDLVSSGKDADSIKSAQDKYGDIAASYARVTTEEFLESPAAKNLTPRQQTAARKLFGELTSRVSDHFTPDGLNVPDNPEVKAAALAQHAGYVAGELSRQFPELNQSLARAAIEEHFTTGGDVEKLADKLGKAGGPDISFFDDNGWMTGNGKNDKGQWEFWGFGDLDVALNVPGVYGGEATRAFAEALSPGKGDQLMSDALNKNFWERSPEEAAVVEFCMRSSQAGWLVSKLGRGIVEANNPKKEGRAAGNWQHHDMMSFDALKVNKGWSEMVKDIDQTRSMAVHSGIISASEAEPKPLEEAMLSVMSHGLFDKGDDGKLTLSSHGETLRTYLKDEAYKAVAIDDFDQRNEVHGDAFAMQAATQAAHAVQLDGAVFPAFLGHFLESAISAGKEFDGGGGASAAGGHALKAFMDYAEAAVPLVGQTQPADVFNMVVSDLGFDPIKLSGAQLKENCQQLVDLGVIAGYGSERVGGDADQGIAPMSADNAALDPSGTHAMDVGLRLANNTWGSGQVHRHYNELQDKGASDRLERGAYDLFDAHKMGTYDEASEQLTDKGIGGERNHELALSAVTFEVYKDLFQLTDAIEDLQKAAEQAPADA